MKKALKRYFIVSLSVWMGLSPAAHAETIDAGSRAKAWSPYIKLSGGATQASTDGLPSGKEQASGPTGTLAVGVGTVFSNGFYLGGEAFAAWNKLSLESKLTTEEDVEFHVTRKARESFGGALHLGYALNQDSFPSLIYVRMGVEQMNWARHAYATESSLDLYEDI